MSKLVKQGNMPFTQVNNELFNDKRLSRKAKGLYGYLYSKPDDWDFSCERIANEGVDGVKSVESGVRELEQSGRIDRKKQGNGRMVYTIYRQLPNRQPAKQPDSLSGGLEGISNTEDIQIEINIEESKKEINQESETDVSAGGEISTSITNQEGSGGNPPPVPLAPSLKRQDIDDVINHMKAMCKKHELQYMSGDLERPFAKHILSNKMAEDIKEYNLPLYDFIETIIRISNLPYCPKVNTPQDFYKNRGHVINAGKKYKMKQQEEKNKQEESKKPSIKLT